MLDDLQMRFPNAFKLLVYLTNANENDENYKKELVNSLTAFSMLLKFRNRSVNRLQLINSLCIYKNGARKNMFEICHQAKFSVSYSTICEALDARKAHIVSRIEAEKLSPNKIFQLIMDNVNWAHTKSIKTFASGTNTMVDNYTLAWVMGLQHVDTSLNATPRKPVMPKFNFLSCDIKDIQSIYQYHLEIFVFNQLRKIYNLPFPLKVNFLNFAYI